MALRHPYHLVCSIEYVIVRQLEYFEQSGSDRHIRDIRGMLHLIGEYVDHAKLQRLIAERELAASWQRAKDLPS